MRRKELKKLCGKVLNGDKSRRCKGKIVLISFRKIHSLHGERAIVRGTCDRCGGSKADFVLVGDVS
jgi:hypothetical protein